MYNYTKMNEDTSTTIYWIMGLFLCGVMILGSMFGYPAYRRYQILQDERNTVTVNDIAIQQTEQLVQVQKQKAQIAIEEAKGISEAQRIINGTLTPLYVQHEAIQAQKDQVNGQNHTVIYIPSGANGVPLTSVVPQP